MLVTDEKQNYEGSDLADMSAAKNYYKWILDKFSSYFGKHIVEVGAGVGTISKKIITEHKPEKFHAVDPSPDVYPMLKEELKSHKNANTHNAFLKDMKSNVTPSADTVLYFNVLEHVEKDEEEVKEVFDMLESDGHLLIFVPALQALYGKFDEKVGHYRRYSKKQLEEIVTKAGFEIEQLHYVDFLGMIPWFILFRIFRQDSIGGKGALYDKLVPIISRIENFIKPPIGKNLFLVAKKP